MRIIQNPKPPDVGRSHRQQPSRVVVYDDYAELGVYGDEQPHLVDVEAAEKVAEYRWNRIGNGYARAWIDGYNVYLHRFIVGTIPTGMEVDHIDRDKRNNRRANLRCATHAENHYNMPRYSNNASGAPGVCWDKGHDKWMAYIQANGKRRFLGYFKNFDDAVAARKAAETSLFQSFAPGEETD